MGASHAYLIDQGTSVRIIVHRWQELSSSRFFHSIAHLKSHKTIYFQKSKTIDHLGHGWSHYTLVTVLCFLDWFLASFWSKNAVWVKTNIIFGISIENWVDSCMFQVFPKIFIFHWKLTLYSPPGISKKWCLSKTLFGLWDRVPEAQDY